MSPCDDKYCRCSMFYPCGDGCRLQPPRSLQVVKGEQKGQSEGSGKPLLCILSYEETMHRGGGESSISLNHNLLVLAAPL